MALILPLLCLAVAVAALLIVPAATPILGLSHGAFAGVALGLALLGFMLFSDGVRRGGLLRAFGSAAIWAVLILALSEFYAYRDQFAELAGHMLDDLTGSEPTIGQGGEVVIRKGFGDEFQVPAKVDDQPVRFVLDTGATSVVLTAEDARRVGLDLRQLDFSAPVATANGAALAAPVRLDRVAVGPIVLRNVRALVVRSGSMRESLLGMTFLERLDSFTVERGRLILKAK